MENANLNRSAAEASQIQREDEQQRRTFIFNGAISVSMTAIIVATLSMLFFASEGLPDAVVTYEVEPQGTELCVGDPLVFHQTVTINEDAVIRLYAAVVTPNGRTVQDVDVSLRTTIRRAGERFSGVRTVVLDDLEPGVYEYRLGAETSGHNSGFIFIPFTVVDCK